MKTRRSILGTAGAALVAVVGGAGPANAASPPPAVLLGRRNRSASPTALQSTSARPALEVRGAGPQALRVVGGLRVTGALTVGSRAVVSGLNADRVDGFDATAFAMAAHPHAPAFDTGWFEVGVTRDSMRLVPDGAEVDGVDFEHGLAGLNDAVVALDWQEWVWDQSTDRRFWAVRSGADASLVVHVPFLYNGLLGPEVRVREWGPRASWSALTATTLTVTARSVPSWDSNWSWLYSDKYKLRLRVWASVA